MIVSFSYESCGTLKSFTLFITITELNLGHSNELDIKIKNIWSFHIVVLPKTAKKYTKTYNARTQLLFHSLNFMFSDLPIAVMVVLNWPLSGPWERLVLVLDDDFCF